MQTQETQWYKSELKGTGGDGWMDEWRKYCQYDLENLKPGEPRALMWIVKDTQPSSSKGSSFSSSAFCSALAFGGLQMPIHASEVICQSTFLNIPTSNILLSEHS